MSKRFLAVLILSALFCQSAFAAWPTTSSRTKDWGSETLTDSDLEGQFDLLHTYFNDSLNSSTGHKHQGTTNDGPKIPINSSLTIASQAAGDIIYASSSSAWARLAKGTNGHFLTLSSGVPSWAAITVYVPRSTWNNLVATRTSNDAMTVTADELVVQDSSFNSARITGVSETITITTAGASGLVAALSEAANTLYYVWIARKSSDGTVNGFLSTSATFATVLGQLDAGYDQACLVSVVGNDNSSNFIPFTQTGRSYVFTSWATMASGSTASVSTSIDLTPANLSTNPGFVAPALSNHAYGTINAGSTASISNISPAASTSIANVAQASEGTSDQVSWEFDVITADTLYWQSNDAGSAVYLQGFEINKLG